MFECDDLLKPDKEIDTYFATSSLKKHLQEGIGGDRVIYMALSKKDKEYLLGYVKNREERISIEKRKSDFGFIKTTVPIKSLFVDWESEIVADKFREYPILERILRRRYENDIPLKSIVDVCKIEGKEYFLNNTWVVHRGVRIDNVEEF